MIWYPYEQMKTMNSPYEIVDAEGPYLYTKDAKLLDSIILLVERNLRLPSAANHRSHLPTGKQILPCHAWRPYS